MKSRSRAITSSTPPASCKRRFSKRAQEASEHTNGRSACRPAIFDSALKTERISKLGALAERDLASSGFQDVRNINHQIGMNYPFGDILCVKDDVRYFISVKARNEMKQGGQGINLSYNLAKINDAKNNQLKAQGKTPEEIRQLLLEAVGELARRHDAVLAWVALSLLPFHGSYSAYFGRVSELANVRSIPMTLGSA